MKKATWFLLSLGLVLAVSLPANATYVGGLLNYDGSENTVGAYGYGGFYEWSSQGYQPKSVQNLGTQLSVGDILVGVFNAHTVNNQTQFSGELTKYLVLEVKEISGNNIVKFGGRSSGRPDPFGVLAADEVLRVYLDSTKNFTILGSRSASVASATDGTLFASFKLGDSGTAAALQVYTPIAGGLGAAVNVSDTGGWNWLKVTTTKVPGMGQLESNLVIEDALLSFATPTAGGVWSLSLSDKESFRLTPEPGTMAGLIGLGLSGLVGFAFRRKRA